KRIYPWGDHFEADRANLLTADYPFRPTPVGMYAKGKNPWGVEDVVGNIWEWTSSLHLPYPYRVSAAENKEAAGPRCIRGGSWSLDPLPGARGATRHSASPWSPNMPNCGFRCAAALQTGPTF